MTERLFSYGTLQTEPVQLSIFGRKLEGKPDALVGYRLQLIQVQDLNFLAHSDATQRNLQYTGNTSDVVEGSVLTLTSDEIELSDAYEPVEYKRVQVRLRSGLDAWVYLS
jgi:gamma-glutamyl AIG2-like cyclotransferase